MGYLRQNLIALDQCVNALTGGWADETLSSRLWRLEVRRKLAGRILRPVVDWVFRVFLRHNDHCLSAYLNEMARKQLPESMRGPRD